MVSLEIIIFVLGILLGAIFFGKWGERPNIMSILKDAEIMYPLVLGALVILLIFWLGAYLFGSDSPILNGNMLSYTTNLWTEGISIGITIAVIDQFNRRRDRENLKRQLLRNAKSTVRDVAVHAIDELRAEGWLMGENGILKGQRIYRAVLDKARLQGANLQGAGLGQADLQTAILVAANLQKTHLDFANLQDANLVGANLQNAYLWKANLEGADLGQTNLQDANLKNTNLQAGRLWNSNLEGADLYKANLQDANLENANLQNANLQDAKFDEKTVLPDAIILRDENDKIIGYDKYWTAETDMSRYTNPDHPDFWQPEWAKNPNESKSSPQI